MKILFVIHDFLPNHQAGAEIYTYLLAREMSKHHEVCIFFAEISAVNFSYSVAKRTYDNLQCIEVTRPLTTDLLGEPFNDKKMEEIFEEIVGDFQPDIIHLQHLFYHSFNYPAIARKKSIPTLFTLHDYWLTCPRWGQRMRRNLQLCHAVDLTRCAECLYEKPAYTRFFSLSYFHYVLRRWLTEAHSIEDRVKSLERRQQLARSAMDNVDLFIAPSPFLRSEFIRFFDIPEKKIIFSDYGFDTNSFSKKRRSKHSKIRFAFIGTLSDHKGVHVLVEAFNRIDQNKAELHIYGDATWFPHYFSSLEKAADPSLVSFKGPVPNNAVAELLTSIDVLVVPSVWFENSPLTIHEAFMAGVPVITSNLGGMADLVTDGVNGLLFSAGDSQDLAGKIKKLIESDSLLDTLRQGIPAVKTIDENSREIEFLYRQLLDNKVAW